MTFSLLLLVTPRYNVTEASVRFRLEPISSTMILPFVLMPSNRGVPPKRGASSKSISKPTSSNASMTVCLPTPSPVGRGVAIGTYGVTVGRAPNGANVGVGIGRAVGVARGVGVDVLVGRGTDVGVAVGVRATTRVGSCVGVGSATFSGIGLIGTMTSDALGSESNPSAWVLGCWPRNTNNDECAC